MPRCLLLGLGNDLLTDDAIGLRVAAAARDRLANQADITVLASAEMGLALLDLMAGFDVLAVVDAVQTGRAVPGTVHELEGDDLPAFSAAAPHFLGLGETLALGRRLGLPVPHCVKIFAVEAEDPYTVGTDLTPVLDAALPGLVERVVSACLSEGFRSGYTPATQAR